MFNTIVGAGAGAGAASRYGSGSDQKMRLLVAPAPALQHLLVILTEIPKSFVTVQKKPFECALKQKFATGQFLF
jgi:hypothetical protein